MKTPTDATIELLELAGIRLNYIPSIPELIAERRTVFVKIFRAIQDYASTHDINVLRATLSWCAYAGIGAVVLWDADWESLKRKGVYEALTEEYGISAMDEYALDISGIGFGTDEANALGDILHEYSRRITWEFMPLKKHPASLTEQYTNCFLGAYHFGMIYQMRRLGMN